MKIAAMTVRLRASWVHSLKEKRMEVQSLLTRVRGRFNVSACETDEQDVHQIIVLTVAAVAADSAQADSVMDNVLHFIEGHTDALLLDTRREDL